MERLMQDSLMTGMETSSNRNVDAALQAAMQTFWRYGYHPTAVSDLVSAMAWSRSSIYQRYGDKAGLFVAALERYRAQQIAALDALYGQRGSAWSFIEALFHQVAEEAGNERAACGCLIFNAATELGGERSWPAEKARDCVDVVHAYFASVVRSAQREGAIDLRHDPGSTARYITLSMSGLRLMNKSGVSTEEARQAVDHILNGLRGPPRPAY
jgi:TetR/AcrR family transcriptional repressor of nem operon